MGSRVPWGWQVGWRFIPSSREAGVLLSTAGQGLIVLDSLRRLCRILMPFQFELNEVTPNTTHSNCGVETLLNQNFTNAFILEWRGIFTKYLGYSIV